MNYEPIKAHIRDRIESWRIWRGDPTEIREARIDELTMLLQVIKNLEQLQHLTDSRICPVCNGHGTERIKQGFGSITQTCHLCHGYGAQNLQRKAT